MTNQEINLAVATIAGWTDVEIYQPERNLAIKTYQGTNKAHPELGIFIPNYCESIDAITKVFDLHNIKWSVDNYGFASASDPYVEMLGRTPSIALCKLLLAINPEPLKPVPKAEMIEASFG